MFVKETGSLIKVMLCIDRVRLKHQLVKILHVIIKHGFRAMRSTMTALTAMQKEWVKSSEDGLLFLLSSVSYLCMTVHIIIYLNILSHL